jgi:exodeoxyribonuclease-5
VLTVQSQGSQWDDVVLFDESFAFRDSRARWLYMGITQAAKRLSGEVFVIASAARQS